MSRIDEFNRSRESSGGKEATPPVALFAESNSADYTDDIMGDTALDLNAEAAKLGYTPESALETLRQASATARETTGRAKETPRPEQETQPATSPPATGSASKIERALAAAKAEALARGERGLARSIQRHLAERESIPLPEGGYTNPDDALAAARIGNNFTNLQKRLKAAGMTPLPPDDRVRNAWRLSKAFFRTADAA
jgi:hypothetical protein